VTVTNSSTGTSIENNVISIVHDPYVICPTTTPNYGVSVDSTSASSTTSDYNGVNADSALAVYNWGGTAYASAAALYAATKQGQHDFNSDYSIDSAEGSPLIDSANSDAIGELPTDFFNQPRVTDPTVAQTGVGTYDYYDRGAYEFEDPLTLKSPVLIDSNSTVPVGTSVNFTTSATDTWGDKLDFVFVWDDGTADTDGSSVTHTFATTGVHKVFVEAGVTGVTPVVPVGANGKIDIYNGGAQAGSTDVIADVVGFFSAGGANAYVPIAPTRLFDSLGNIEYYNAGSDSEPVALILDAFGYFAAN